MKRFSEMNPTLIAIVGTGAAALLLVGALSLGSLPLLTGRDYRALVAEAGGLRPDDPVHVAGIGVGKVGSVSLDGSRVAVDFVINDSRVTLGEDTTVAIKTGTILGKKFLEVTPRGGEELPSGSVIPLERTTAPYQLTEELGQATEKVRNIDVGQLTEALDTMSGTLEQVSPEARSALEGIQRISETVNSRDKALKELLAHAEGATGVLASRKEQMRTLVVDGNALLQEVSQRRQAIRGLIVNASAMARQTNALMAENRAELRPALQRLEAVLEVLKRNEGNLAVALQRLGPFARSLGESVASGPFFNAYIPNLVPGNLIGPPMAKEFARFNNPPLPHQPGTPQVGGPR
ncbi:MAG: MCE family protein [Rhodospirillales bacterium]|nr:MCE family protein [Rhodospirillales bacterium]